MKLAESIIRRLPRSLAAAACALAALWGCAQLPEAPQAVPVRHSLVRDQLIISSDSPLPAQHRLLDELCAQRTELLGRLHLPLSQEPIYVYLFDNQEEFNAFVRASYPSFPSRRAFFVETDTRLAVYAHWGDRVAEDLRHEVAHGYLHSVVPSIPLWLDEGLAEFSEVPRVNLGLNRPHLDDLAARMSTGWRPDLRRLESLKDVGEMTQGDYAESWAWVHLLLETTPDRHGLICGYLHSLRQNASAEPLSIAWRRLHPHPEGLLIEHLQRLIARPAPPVALPSPTALPSTAPPSAALPSAAPATPTVPPSTASSTPAMAARPR